MITHIAPSIVGPYDLVSSFDASLDWPEPPARAPGESDADHAARLEADFEPRRAEFRRLLVIARDTGNWTGVLKPGEDPSKLTRFRVRQMPPAHALQWDRVTAGMSPIECGALAIRCVLLGATNWIPGFTVGAAVEHLDLQGRPSGLGRIAPADVIDSFYAVAPGRLAEMMIADLGGQIVNRRSTTSGN